MSVSSIHFYTVYRKQFILISVLAVLAFNFFIIVNSASAAGCDPVKKGLDCPGDYTCSSTTTNCRACRPEEYGTADHPKCVSAPAPAAGSGALQNAGSGGVQGGGNSGSAGADSRDDSRGGGFGGSSSDSNVARTCGSALQCADTNNDNIISDNEVNKVNADWAGGNSQYTNQEVLQIIDYWTREKRIDGGSTGTTPRTGTTPPTSTGEDIPLVCGDVGDLHQDGVINNKDKFKLGDISGKVMAGAYTPSSDEIIRGDLDGDAQITGNDYFLIDRFLSGQLARFTSCGSISRGGGSSGSQPTQPGENQAPIADFMFDEPVADREDVLFVASADDPDGFIAEYTWGFYVIPAGKTRSQITEDDRRWIRTGERIFAWFNAGEHVVGILWVTDNLGMRTKVEKQFQVTAPRDKAHGSNPGEPVAKIVCDPLDVRTRPGEHPPIIHCKSISQGTFGTLQWVVTGPASQPGNGSMILIRPTALEGTIRVKARLTSERFGKGEVIGESNEEIIVLQQHKPNADGNQAPVFVTPLNIPGYAVPYVGSSTYFNMKVCDPDGDKVMVNIEYGDGGGMAAEVICKSTNFLRVFLREGDFVAKATAIDEWGASSTSEIRFHIGSLADNTAKTIDFKTYTRPENVDFILSNPTPRVGETVTVQAVGTISKNLAGITFNFGDRTSTSNETNLPIYQGADPLRTVSHTYAKAGSYIIYMAVVDTNGQVASTSKWVQVGLDTLGTAPANVVNDDDEEGQTQTTLPVINQFTANPSTVNRGGTVALDVSADTADAQGITTLKVCQVSPGSDCDDMQCGGARQCRLSSKLFPVSPNATAATLRFEVTVTGGNGTVARRSLDVSVSRPSPQGISRIDYMTISGQSLVLQDTDGDTIYEDANENGTFDFADCVLLYQEILRHDQVRYNPAFDFNDNGVLDGTDGDACVNKLTEMQNLGNASQAGTNGNQAAGNEPIVIEKSLLRRAIERIKQWVQTIF